MSSSLTSTSHDLDLTPKVGRFILLPTGPIYSKHRTGTLRCLQKEMATYRHWSVSLWRDLTLSNPVPWQNWMTAYLGYTLRMRTLFRGWPIMVHETCTRRRRQQNCFIRFQNTVVHKFDNGQTNKRTDGEVDNVMPPASLDCRRHKKQIPEWVGVHIKDAAQLFKVKHLWRQQSSHSQLTTVCCCNRWRQTP